MSLSEQLKIFVEYAGKLSGYEKGEAQLFCDRLFRAFGHGGIIEANGQLEARIKFASGRTKFADCLWAPIDRPGVLIEMKAKSEKNLEAHFPQVRDYWIEMNPERIFGPGSQKPTYIILCNFERILIYRHLSLVDELSLSDVIDRSSSLNFLLPEIKTPIFKINVEAVSKDAANTLGELYGHLISKVKIEPEIAQRYLLQSVLALFSEDFGLLPNSIFSELIRDCQKGQNAYDLIGGLFHQMANPKMAQGGRFKEVRYFNGGLFEKVEPFELDSKSLNLLAKAAEYNWKQINPGIFGSLFESTLSSKERHAFGAHYTSEVNILKIVHPTIIRPWRQEIQSAQTLEELTKLYAKLATFKILDPACGCGNFLYVAYHALKDIEMELIGKIANNFSERKTENLHLGHSRITTKQFFGLDVIPIAVEVAKMTMMVAKEVAAVTWNNRIPLVVKNLGLDFDEGLPLDSLNDCILLKDALLNAWPKCDAIIGNPPFQSKNKMQSEMNPIYLEKIRKRYPEVPGRADFCVYWFRRAHDELQANQRAGLVGTNTIRQNYSRQGGLDYIVSDGGTITDAVSTQVWNGEAVVHVSIANWVKGDSIGKKILATQKGDSTEDPFEFHELDQINSSLSPKFDVAKAKDLAINIRSKACFQGQTHGHKGFLLAETEAFKILSLDKKYRGVLFPFMTGKEELLGAKDSLPKRFVIDFRKQDAFEAREYELLFEILKKEVYPERKKKSEEEEQRNEKTLKQNEEARVNHHHTNFYRNWWKMSYARDELMDILETLPRYCVCVRTTKRPIFEFIDSSIHPNDALQVFPLEDDYSFGILQSNVHWEWFCAKSSTLKSDWRYTSNTVFDSFPWPQKPSRKQILSVSKCAKALRIIRREAMIDHKWSLRELYRNMEETPNNPVNYAQEDLDEAVRNAYTMGRRDDILEYLFNLNQQLFEKEVFDSAEIDGPGFPNCDLQKSDFVSTDCVSMSKY